MTDSIAEANSREALIKRAHGAVDWSARPDGRTVLRQLDEEGFLADPEQSVELADLDRTLKILTATTGAKAEWMQLARNAIAGAVKWKTELCELERFAQRDRAQAVRATAGREQALAERDELQARIDAALDLARRYDHHGIQCSTGGVVAEFRAALQGEVEPA